MKNLYILIFSILIGFSGFATENNTTAYAENLYSNQQYDSCIAIYTSIIEHDSVSAALYYNLANAYFKNNELAQAILYYERAYLLNPNDEQIKHNLEFAYSKQVDKVESISTGIISKWYASVFSLTSITVWAIVSVLVFFCFLFCVYIFLFSRSVKQKKLSFFIGIFSLIISATTFAFANSRYNQIHSHEYAIIIEPTVSIKTEPNQNSKDLTVVHSGLKVLIKDQVNNWYFVRLDDGNKGWVLQDFIEKI